jgi:hypothetical protein
VGLLYWWLKPTIGENQMTQIIERSEAETQLEAALARVAALRQQVGEDKAKGERQAEIVLKNTFFTMWQAGDLKLADKDAKRLHDASAKKVKGKSAVAAKKHLETLFAPRPVGEAPKPAGVESTSSAAVGNPSTSPTFIPRRGDAIGDDELLSSLASAINNPAKV